MLIGIDNVRGSFVTRAARTQVAISMLDSHNHSEAVGHLELATGKRLDEGSIANGACSLGQVSVVPKYLQ